MELPRIGHGAKRQKRFRKLLCRNHENAMVGIPPCTVRGGHAAHRKRNVENMRARGRRSLCSRWSAGGRCRGDGPDFSSARKESRGRHYRARYQKRVGLCLHSLYFVRGRRGSSLSPAQSAEAMKSRVANRLLSQRRSRRANRNRDRWLRIDRVRQCDHEKANPKWKPVQQGLLFLRR